MTNQMNGGVSTRSLVLLGAFAALALNKDLRRNLVLGTRSAIDNAQSTLDDTVLPALSSAAQQAQHAAAVAAEQAGHTWETLRDEAPERAHTLFGTAQEAVGTLAATAADRAAQLRKEAEQTAKQARKDYKKQYAPKLNAWQEDLKDMAEERRHQAEKAVKQAKRKGMVALADLGEKASSLREDAVSTLEDNRRDAERALARARRDAEKELRRTRKNWNKKKLERAVEKRMAPVYKQVQSELDRLEKQAGRKTRRLQAELKPERRSSGLGGVGTGVLLLGAGAVVLARVPEARRGLLSAVESVSPDAAKKLHNFSRQARNLVGDMWLESMETAEPPATGAAKGTQAATTGSSAYATPEPGSPAAAKPVQPEQKPSDNTEAKTDKADSDKPKTN